MEQQYTAALDRILRSLRQKYQQLDGILAATGELVRLAGGEDPEGFGLYLTMRSNHMRRIDDLDKEVNAELALLPDALATEVRLSMDGNAADGVQPPAFGRLLDADNACRVLHARILEADARLTERVQGAVAG